METFGERIGWSPFSPAARAGGYVFASGVMPVDWRSGLLPAARPAPGHVQDPLRLQSVAALGVLEKALRNADCELRDVGRLTQWFRGAESWPHGSEWSGISISRYMEARAEKFPSGTPSSTAVAVRDLLSKSVLLSVDAVAVPKEEVRILPSSGEPGRPRFPPGTVAGGRAYLSGQLPTDWKNEGGIAVHPDARLDGALWYGSPAREQARFVLDSLCRHAETAGTSLDRALHSNVFLADNRDLPGFEEAWLEFFPDAPPARTVISGCGLAARGCRVEVDMELALPGERLETVKTTDVVPVPGHAAQAIRCGELLYVSGQMAVSEDGVHPSGVSHPEFGSLCAPTAAQLRLVLERIERICREAGSSLQDVAMLRLFTPELPELGGALHVLEEAFGEERPAGTVVGTGDLPVAGCRIMADAVVHTEAAG